MESLAPVPAIIASRADPASVCIAESLVRHFQFSKHDSSNIDARMYFDSISLTMIDELGIFAKPGNTPQGTTSLMFTSKHVSASGKPALTVHATGNLTREALCDGELE